MAAFIDQHEAVFVVEQNRDAQMRTVLVTELEVDPARLQPVLYYDGSPLSAQTVFSTIVELLGHPSGSRTSDSEIAAGD